MAEAPGADPLEELHALEARALEQHDFATVRPWAEHSGADPWLVDRLAPARYLGLLRGTAAVVLLDGQGKTIAEAAAPAGATGWTRPEPGRLLVVGERSAEIFDYDVSPEAVTLVARHRVAEVSALRDIASGPADRVFLADRHRGRILAARMPARPERADSGGRELAVETVGRCAGALRVLVAEPFLLANCLLDHRLQVWNLSPADGLERPVAVVEHDGPMWSLDAKVRAEGLDVALTGVEDHPLDRSDGSFGYIDSFLFVLRIEADAAVSRVATVNLSEHGVVTPKWVRWAEEDVVWTAGYGSAGGALVDLAGVEPRVRALDLPPGLTALAGDPGEGLGADPLLDAWVEVGPEGWRLRSVPDPGAARPPEQRLGEALVFTTLMGPANEAKGKRSRFTCETCHYEGTVDGRTHYTGRGEVHATTKTLRGLFGNRPHFTRALDRSTTEMIDNEFRVANRGSTLSPWFDLETRDHPWLDSFWPAGTLDAAQLRRSVFAFLTTFECDRNPSTRGRTAFTPLERRGAAVFAEHCESCHQARLRTDDPASAVEVPAWEGSIFGGGPIVWARAERVKTGVEPYVHDEGARVPSLRRLWAKRPYFTDGSAADLDAVLAEVELGPPFAHRHAAPAQRPLTPEEAGALRAFLDLL